MNKALKNRELCDSDSTQMLRGRDIWKIKHIEQCKKNDRIEFGREKSVSFVSSMECHCLHIRAIK